MTRGLIMSGNFAVLQLTAGEGRQGGPELDTEIRRQLDKLDGPCRKWTKSEEREKGGNE